MTRLLYQWLLWLHPPQFRREFAGEMLWIFESSVDDEGSAGLISDAAVSLARQWLLRSGAWKIGVALAGALLQVGVGSIAMLVFTRDGVNNVAAAAYTGTWAGTLRTHGVSKPVEIVFGRDHGTWLGLFTASDHTDSIAGFRAMRSDVSFRVPTPDGDLLFHGQLTPGKLSGTFQRVGDRESGVWEVARPAAAVSSASIDTKQFVGLVAVLAAAIIASVVLLALWARRFMWGRFATSGGSITSHGRRSTPLR
jgi:hypothetical protein